MLEIQAVRQDDGSWACLGHVPVVFDNLTHLLGSYGYARDYVAYVQDELFQKLLDHRFPTITLHADSVVLVLEYERVDFLLGGF